MNPHPAEVVPDDLIDVTQAAKEAHCHVGTIHRWIGKGRLRGWKRCGRWFVSQGELLGLFTPRTRLKHAQAIPTARTLAAQKSYADAVLRRFGIRKEATEGTRKITD
jgi:hypothetical protein